MTVEDIALTMTPGLGVRGLVQLLDRFGDARSIYSASADELAEGGRLRSDAVRSLLARSAFSEAERELARCRRAGVVPLASTDPDYPPLLRDIPDYPHVLYVVGDPAALRARCVAIIGTREATPYGQRVCGHLVQGLAARVPDLCVVSGLAFGIDVAAHRAALASEVRTVAVLANPLPGVTPAQHAPVARDIVEHGGALVSELNGCAKQRGTFYVARNRIIAALSAGTVVVESPCGGGSLLTAHCADSYGRSVMAVPGRAVDAASRGTNLLIRNRKAQLVLTGDDVVEELMWDLDLPPEARTAPQEPQLTDSERALLSCFSDSDPLSVEELSHKCGAGVGELSALLLGLEMSGLVRQLPGNRYVRVK